MYAIILICWVFMHIFRLIPSISTFARNKECIANKILNPCTCLCQDNSGQLYQIASSGTSINRFRTIPGTKELMYISDKEMDELMEGIMRDNPVEQVSKTESI